MPNEKLVTHADISALAERLAKLAYIDRAETPCEDEPPSVTLAAALGDIEDSARDFLEHLGQLVDATDAYSLRGRSSISAKTFAMSYGT